MSVDPVFLGAREGLTVLSAKAAAPPASLLPPCHCPQIRALFGSPSKPRGRGHGSVFGARAPEAVLGPPLHQALWDHGAGGFSPSPTPSALQRPRRPGGSPESALPGGGRMVTLRGWTETPWSPRQAHCQARPLLLIFQNLVS